MDKIKALLHNVGNRIKKCFKEVLSWSWKKRLLVGSCTFLVFSGILTVLIGVILLRNLGEDYNAEAVVNAMPMAVELELNAATQEALAVPEEPTEPTQPMVVDVAVPQFKACSVAGESMEKDLTLYIKGENKKKIKGVKFQVKLLAPKEAAKLAEAEKELDEINKKLKAAAKGEAVEISEEHKQELLAQARQKAEIAEGTEYQMPELSAEAFLLMDKQTAIAAYASKLQALSGETYTDKDADGMIYVNNINAGDYVACYVPVAAYDASDYTLDVKVKDKVEYVAVPTIEDKTVNYSAAGDTKEPRQETPVEAVLVDTVKYIESSTKKVDAVYALTKAAPLKAEVGEMHSVSKEYKAEGGSVSTEGGVELETEPSEAAEPTETRPTETQTAKMQTATMSVNKSATVFSGNPALGKIELAFSSKNVDSVKESFKGSAVSIEKNEKGNYVVTAGDTEKDTTVEVTFEGTCANGEDKFTITCEVKVVGSATKLQSPDKKALFMDDKGKTAATVVHYDTEASYYYVKEEAYTIYYGWQNIDGKRYFFDENGNPVKGKQIISGVEYTFGSDGVLLTRGYGIDVSKWQGNIDWSQASKAISFAIIRCGFRGSSGRIATDPYFEKNIVGAKANGVKVGVYFYSRAMNEVQAVEEASLAVSLVKKYGISLPIYIDMEDSCQLSLTTEQRMNIIRAFCTTVQNSGYSAGVYANKNWLTNYLTPNSLAGNISIWCAQYNTKCTYKGRYDIWQYSSKGSVPGIKGNVDMNISYF